MGKHDVASFDDDSKPAKPKSDRYAWHACWHDDAWRGIELMPPEVVGIYWRIILLMYRRQAALPDNDREIAMVCHAPLKVYRRAKARLIEAGRIEVDEINGTIYCKRAVKQLVKDQRYRESQSKNGAKGGRPTLAIDNVISLSERDKTRTAIDLDPYLEGDLVVSNSTPSEEKQQLTKSQTKATQTHTQIDNQTPDSKRQTPASRAAAPPLRGSGAPTEKQERRTAALEALHRAFGSSGRPEANEEGFDATEPNGAKHGAQTCRRSPS